MKPQENMEKEKKITGKDKYTIIKVNESLKKLIGRLKVIITF